MVEISEVIEEEPPTPPPPPPPPAAVNETKNANANAVESRSQERLSDADEIEAALSAHITRPSAQMHLQNLITKLRKEGKALQRVAASTSAAAAEAEAASPAVPPAKRAAPATTTEEEVVPTPTPPKKSPVTQPIVTSSTNKYQTFPTHYFDCGEYNSPLVTVYVPLTGIGTHNKSKISCDFTPNSFDLIVSDFITSDDGKLTKSYRLLNDNLEKEIDVSKSKYVVKANKIIIKLGKIKGEYSYDHWTELTAKKKKTKKAGGGSNKDDPTAGIMDLMKDMYDSGDDNMKKMIGETMYKQRTGQLGKDGMMPGMGGGMGGMGDMGLGDMGI